MATRAQQRETRRRLMARLQHLSSETFRGCGVNPETGVAATCYGVPFHPDQARSLSDAELRREIGRLERSLGAPPPPRRRPRRFFRRKPWRRVPWRRRFAPWRRRPHWNPTAWSDARAAAERLSWKLLDRYAELGILLVGVGDEAGAPVVVVFVQDPDMHALPNVIPGRVGGVRVVIRPGHAGLLPQLGDETTGTVNTLGDALMIAAPLVLFGGLVYVTTRDRGLPREVRP